MRKALSSRPVRYLAYLLIVDLLLVLSYVCVSLMIVHLYHPSTAVDAALVFFENFGPHDGISAGTLERVNEAEALYRSGYAKHIICLGGGKPTPPIRGAVLMCELLQKRGIPDDALFPDQLSWDTKSNWNEAERIMDQHGWRSAALVSAPLHVVRIFAVTNSSSKDVSLAPHPWNISGLSTLFVLWRSTHHELVGWLATALLPESTYARLIQWYREKGLRLI